jgi:hypothetical protein
MDCAGKDAVHTGTAIANAVPTVRGFGITRLATRCVVVFGTFFRTCGQLVEYIDAWGSAVFQIVCACTGREEEEQRKGFHGGSVVWAYSQPILPYPTLS